MKKDSESRSFPSRRDVLRILAVGGVAGLGWKLGLFGGKSSDAVTRSRVLMGTLVHLTVVGDDRESAEAAAESTLERMARLESLLSGYRDDSELARLNATGRLEDASDALLDVVRRADEISRLGDGAFDITVLPVLRLYRDATRAASGLPAGEAIEQALERVDHRALRVEGRTVSFDRPGMAITIDGVGKGYVVDQGVAELRGRGFANVFVEAGGDLMASGEKGGGRAWRVGIRNPRAGSALQARFDTRNHAVATSGDYMQAFTPDYSLHHILDPRTGRSAPELASSTVIAPDAATADALATLTMVLGAARSRELLESLPGCEGYFVSKSLDVTRTTGFTLV